MKYERKQWAQDMFMLDILIVQQIQFIKVQYYNQLTILKHKHEEIITEENTELDKLQKSIDEKMIQTMKHKPKNDLYTLHIDPKYSYVKTIIYLNTVQRGNGPFAYIPQSHRWKFNDVEMLFCKSNQLTNTLSTVEQRKINAGKTTLTPILQWRYGQAIIPSLPKNKESKVDITYASKIELSVLN